MFQSTTPRTPRRWNLCTACEQPLNADASSLTSQRRDDTELLHQVEQRRDAPVLGDLAVDDPHGVDGVETDLLPGGRDTEELSLVGAVIGLVGGHEVAGGRSEEHTSELQSLAYLVCRLLLEKKKINSYKDT